MITIDGKSYPLWSQFVEGKDKWIGGIVEEFSDEFCEGGTTEITDITLDKMGEGVHFTIHGKDFDESFDVRFGGISGGEKSWLIFHVVGFSGFRIKPK